MAQCQAGKEWAGDAEMHGTELDIAEREADGCHDRDDHGGVCRAFAAE